MNFMETITDIEENLIFNEELSHYYIIDIFEKKMYIKEGRMEKELVKVLDKTDLLYLNDINEFIYRNESYANAVDYANGVYGFKYFKKVVIKIFNNKAFKSD